jgi:hypothetical protein
MFYLKMITNWEAANVKGVNLRAGFIIAQLRMTKPRYFNNLRGHDD